MDTYYTPRTPILPSNEIIKEEARKREGIEAKQHNNYNETDASGSTRMAEERVRKDFKCRQNRNTTEIHLLKNQNKPKTAHRPKPKVNPDEGKNELKTARKYAERARRIYEKEMRGGGGPPLPTNPNPDVVIGGNARIPFSNSITKKTETEIRPWAKRQNNKTMGGETRNTTIRSTNN